MTEIKNGIVMCPMSGIALIEDAKKGKEAGINY